MWRKAFHAVLCWLALSQTSGEAVDTVLSSLINDNVSAESAPRLYRNVPVGVYASAAPYAAYSFHVPTFISSPKPAASRIVPVINNANGYLRDSYGNRFVETPQSTAYKTAFPQQFLPLQELPAHLAQPLVAAASQAKQTAPHYFLGSQYRAPTFQVAHQAPQHPVNSFASFSQPVFTQNLRSLAPSSNVPVHIQATTVQQPGQQFPNEVKFQRLELRPAGSQAHTNSNAPHHTGAVQIQEDKGQIQAAPATITAVVNGKKTVVNIDTKPPVPLLDLSLLEPLTFANPLVPQVQHFLPRINQATYHKLPEANFNDGKQHKKEYAITKTKSYDSGNVKVKAPPKSKTKQNKPELDEDDDRHQRPHPANKPTVTVKGTPELDESPEITYEINAPNHKETFKQKSVTYNKASDAEPVTYTYSEKTQSEPITYSYSKTEKTKPVSYSVVRTSDQPENNKQETYHVQQHPEQLLYRFKPEEQNREQHHHKGETEDAGSAEDTSDESNDDRHSHPQSHDHPRDRPHSQIHYRNNQPHPQTHHHHSESYPHSHRDSRQQNHPHSHGHNGEDYHEEPRNNYNHRSKGDYQRPNEGHERPKEVYHSYPPNHNDEIRHDDEGYHKSNKEVQHRSNGNEHHRHNENVHYKPKDDLHHRPNENGYYRQGDHEEYKQNHAPHHRSQEIKVPVHAQAQYPVTREYEEDIKIVPSEAPAAHLKRNPEEGQKEADAPYTFHPDPLSTLEQYQKFVEEQRRSQAEEAPPQVHSSPAPVIHEKAKRIIIQEESPDEMRVHAEQNIMAEMIEGDGNDEEDFEKAYKNAAYGFQAFDGPSEDQEKDVYNPSNYGFSRHSEEFEVEKTPFQQYQAEGDNFPKSSRAEYKDIRDNTKDDYYTDYAINQPESMAQLYQNKANYYKLYKKYKPDKYFAEENEKKKEKKSGKYIAAPSFDFSPAPQKKQNYFAQYKAAPIKYEYKFAKESPRDRDSSAHASRPYQRYKSKTNFVEPQFQYGFEPIALPRLLDSELAAMASNHSPESEKPGMRKKVYKENWYIKKTSTSGGKPS